jgi:osmotically-inducible protein OsmY
VRRLSVKEKAGKTMKLHKTIAATKTSLLLGVCLVGAGFGIAGCQNTAEGAKEDAAKDTTAVSTAAGNAADATKNAAVNAADATKDAAATAGDKLSMTPKVKTAILANAKLNDPKNSINVDTGTGVVYLKGHVVSNDDKKLATDIAEKTIKDAGGTDKVMNQLTVEQH